VQNLWKTFGKRLIYRMFSKNLINNNQNFTTMQTESYNTLMSKTEAKLRKDNSFVRRNYAVYWIVTILYIAASLASAFAIFVHLNLRGAETFRPSVAVIIAAFLTLLIAGCQYMIKEVVDDWQAKAHIKGGADGAMMFFKGLAALIGMVAGVALSIGGASKAVDVVRKDATEINVDLVSVDSIRNYYDGKIAQINGSIGKQEGTTYKRKITAPATKNLSMLFSTVNDLEKQKAIDMAAATTKNDAALAEYHAETKVNAAGAKGFMGFAELLILVCAIMRGLFDDGLKKEAKSVGVKVGEPF